MKKLTSRTWSADEKVALWKWMATSGTRFEPYHATASDEEFERGKEEQPQIGWCLTRAVSGYREIVGIGKEQEDAIAAGIYAGAGHGVTSHSTHFRTWWTMQADDRTEFEVSDAERVTLRNIWLKRRGFAFLVEAVGSANA